MYGGDGGSSACRYEFRRCTKVDFPAPAIPMVIMVTGFLPSLAGAEPDASADIVEVEDSGLVTGLHCPT